MRAASFRTWIFVCCDRENVVSMRAEATCENVTFCENAYECTRGCHALVIVMEWGQFRAVYVRASSMGMIASSISATSTRLKVMRSGFQYCGVGPAEIAGLLRA
jgi:hypothetical protein